MRRALPAVPLPPNNVPNTLVGVTDGKTRSRLSFLFILLLLLVSVASSYSANYILEGTVVHIADGDTIIVL
jgi:hypothetical protein